VNADVRKELRELTNEAQGKQEIITLLALTEELHIRIRKKKKEERGGGGGQNVRGRYWKSKTNDQHGR